MGKCPLTTLEMETPSTPKPTTPKKPVYVGNVETTGDPWTDAREATKVRSRREPVNHLSQVSVCRGCHSLIFPVSVKCLVSGPAS